jgi:formate dehydrogenase subunit gamma
MRLLHYVATVGGGLLLIVHVYLGTVAYPGTLGGMLHGSVTRAWAKLHHPAWDEGESGS